MIAYTATAGHLVAVDPVSSKPSAKFFYVAFTKDGAAANMRPVTFFYNEARVLRRCSCFSGRSHMIYLDGNSRTALKADLATLYDGATHAVAARLTRMALIARTIRTPIHPYFILGEPGGAIRSPRLSAPNRGKSLTSAPPTPGPRASQPGA